MKPEAECSATIIDFIPGQGEFEGLVGAIVVQLESGVITSASGFDLDTRVAMSSRPREYQGQVVEIAHNGLLESGKLRHPRFRRFRTDLSRP